MPPIVRSALAMRIARLDRLKFNEAVSNGFYHCAPDTRRGSSRLFCEDALIGLYIFARLIELDMLPRRAGGLACDFMGEARANKAEEFLSFLKPAVGNGIILPGKDFDLNQRYSGLGPVVSVHTFNIGFIRKHIADEIEYERNIIGDDDASQGDDA